ncbi:hypothetical protein IGI04_007444 [Brassica rapa subsp. trilocularis]|uniref:Uncharacterized protein n=1 Tax=Brassica rapa subsp. trilocularis TaxID=1813537 RepID=A0ABQ7NJQ5_BRACM|nr:hypothetical protein IGI04_007444 [Brassica rapa subsp. trilocularis]
MGLKPKPSLEKEKPGDFSWSTCRGDRIRVMIRVVGATRISSVSTQPPPLENIAGSASPQNSFDGAQKTEEPPSKPTPFFNALSSFRRVASIQSRSHPLNERR